MSKFFARGVRGGADLLNVNLGLPITSETTRARKLKLNTQLDVVKYSLRVQIFFPLGGVQGRRPPNLNLGPPDISETTRARKLKLKMPLDVVKYPLWVQK